MGVVTSIKEICTDDDQDIESSYASKSRRRSTSPNYVDIESINTHKFTNDHTINNAKHSAKLDTNDHGKQDFNNHIKLDDEENSVVDNNSVQLNTTNRNIKLKITVPTTSPSIAPSAISLEYSSLSSTPIPAPSPIEIIERELDLLQDFSLS